MDKQIKDLLEVGKKRGYVTYEQLETVLPDPLSPDEVARLLQLFYDHDVELIDERDTHPLTDNESPPLTLEAQNNRAFAEMLAHAGVAFTDFACRHDEAGNVFDARLIVLGCDALQTWKRLRDLVPEHHLWPMHTGEIVGSKYAAAQQGWLDHNDYFIDWLADFDIDSVRAQAQLLIEQANRCEPNPATFHRWHTSRLENLSDEEWETLIVGDTPTTLADEVRVFEPNGPFHGHKHALTGEPFAHVEFRLLPCSEPWQAFAHWPSGGSNGMPNPEEQLAMHRAWYTRYGAEIVGHYGDWYEMHVSRPPHSRRDALKLARELTGFAEETILGYGELPFEEMIAIVQNSQYWSFWWD